MPAGRLIEATREGRPRQMAAAHRTRLTACLLSFSSPVLRLISAIEIARGRLTLYRGEDPRPSLEKAHAIAKDAGYTHDLTVIGQLLGEAAVERGDFAEARRILVETLERAKASSPEGEPALDTAWRLALAEEALGDPDRRVNPILDSALARDLNLDPAERTDRGGGFATPVGCLSVIGTTRRLGWRPESRELWQGFRTSAYLT